MKYGKNNHIELNGIENTRGSSAVRSFLFYLNMNLTRNKFASKPYASQCRILLKGVFW